MKGKQSLSINNKLVMTLQVQLAIKLLQLNSVDLQKEIDDKILSNPFLENENSSDSTEVTSEIPVISTHQGSGNQRDDIDEYTNFTSAHETLRDYLLWQIRLSSLSDDDLFIAYNIIDYINDNGYLTESMESLYLLLKKNLEITFQEIFAVLHKIQHLDPIGVGATSLSDCLTLQLDYYHKDDPNRTLAKKIIDNLEDTISGSSINLEPYLENIEKNNDNYGEAIKLIRSLNPKPGSIISDTFEQEHITPDIVISKKDGKWHTELNPSINPRIRINQNYTNLHNEVSNKEDKEYIKSNMQDARFFLKALKNRNLTILKVAKIIFKRQVSFLSQGEIAMKPMTLKDVSTAIGMHESTISRCTNNKYVQTPRGVFEMKYFFSSEIKTDLGGMISSRSIKSMLKKIILDEDKNSPMSDSQIANNLSDNGIKIARRTITKYREILSIPKAKERKRSL